LDHHQGCLRAFTLATCEQALVLVLKGLALNQGDWRIFANEPDLDTVFAIWVLLNHRRLKGLRPEAREVLFPLLRLEGAIDANGFELAEYCGLPRQALTKAQEELNRLHAVELELKRSGNWAEADLADYTRKMLLEIDRLVYRAEDFEGFTTVEEEYGHVEIGGNRVAVVCRDPSGIYEVEKRLKERWGDRLGMIALEVGPQTFTLRRSASLAGIDLELAYRQLDLQDPAVDGRPPEKRWGGSDDIGGSPRPGGTGLEPREIGRILSRAYRPVGRWRQLKALFETCLLAAAPAAAVVAAAFSFAWFAAPAEDRWLHAGPCLAALLALAVVAGLSWRRSRGRLWFFGLRHPAWREGWVPALPALVGCLAVGAWVPPPAAPEVGSWLWALAALLLVAATLEGWFRGLIHGTLLMDFPSQRPAGPWFLSVPVVVSALLFTACTVGAWKLGTLVPALPLPGPALAWVGGGGALAGLSLGLLRERSLSLWPGILVQVLAGLVLLLRTL
jgi:hypothetical protein